MSDVEIQLRLKRQEYTHSLPPHTHTQKKTGEWARKTRVSTRKQEYNRHRRHHVIEAVYKFSLLLSSLIYLSILDIYLASISLVRALSLSLYLALSRGDFFLSLSSYVYMYILHILSPSLVIHIYIHIYIYIYLIYICIYISNVYIHIYICI